MKSADSAFRSLSSSEVHYFTPAKTAAAAVVFHNLALVRVGRIHIMGLIREVRNQCRKTHMSGLFGKTFGLFKLGALYKTAVRDSGPGGR